MPIELTWAQALAWRMRRHHLIERAKPAEMLDVVARIGGLHAQVMSSAELTLHARIDGLERDAVAKALWEDRTLVKLWAMRGTLHLLPASELDTWLGALSTYDHYFSISGKDDKGNYILGATGDVVGMGQTASYDRLAAYLQQRGTAVFLPHPALRKRTRPRPVLA